MQFDDVVVKRRSIRRFSELTFEDEKIKKALQHALLAPNSSNAQTWDFHWVKSQHKKQQLVDACLSQSAARTAQHLIVASIQTNLWKRSQAPLVNWVRSVNAPKKVILYYERLLPLAYSVGFLGFYSLIKWFTYNLIGLFRPIMRGPISCRDLQEVAIKSSALACENFVLSITSQGGATCMMEGFDEVRVKKILNLSCSARIVMVIGVGYEAERGTWGPQFRLPFDSVVHEH